MYTNDKKIEFLFINWLIISLILIFLMIVIGGLTRLTNSGLSITEWELFTGILPPLSQNRWDEYFQLYKTIPQYKLLNYNMTFKEFKIIFYWEYFHRLLGRIIGIFFLIPLLYFHFISKLDIKRLIPCYIVMFLIIVQGIIGWYMVMSGLTQDITVSHYRLSIHLSTAILIISMIFWQILNNKSNQLKSFFIFSKKNFPYLFLILLIFVQIIFGAFVSGLDAGKVYQTWPLMGYSFFPDDLELNKFKIFFDFNSHSLVQFYHRITAYFITAYILILSIDIFKNNKTKLKSPMKLLLFVLLFQITLGVFTLLSDLHIVLASAHQISSVILVLSALNLYYSIIK